MIEIYLYAITRSLTQVLLLSLACSSHQASFLYFLDLDDFEETWEDASEIGLDEEGKEFYETETAPQLPIDDVQDTALQSVKAMTSWLVGFVLLLQVKYSVSDAVLEALLRFLAVFFNVLGRFFTFVAALANNVPPSLYIYSRRRIVWFLV